MVKNIVPLIWNISIQISFDSSIYRDKNEYIRMNGKLNFLFYDMQGM